jgi:hypothetical protein
MAVHTMQPSPPPNRERRLSERSRSARLIRDAVCLLSSKWSVDLLLALGDGTRRYHELLEDLEPISEKVLTQTLRAMERDGLVARRVHAEVPPRGPRTGREPPPHACRGSATTTRAPSAVAPSWRPAASARTPRAGGPRHGPGGRRARRAPCPAASASAPSRRSAADPRAARGSGGCRPRVPAGCRPTTSSSEARSSRGSAARSAYARRRAVHGRRGLG